MCFEKTSFSHIKEEGVRLAAQRGILLAKCVVAYETGGWFSINHKQNALT